MLFRSAPEKCNSSKLPYGSLFDKVVDFVTRKRSISMPNLRFERIRAFYNSERLDIRQEFWMILMLLGSFISKVD